MAYTVLACKGMAYIVMACIGMACIGMAYIVMAHVTWDTLVCAKPPHVRRDGIQGAHQLPIPLWEKAYTQFWGARRPSPMMGRPHAPIPFFQKKKERWASGRGYSDLYSACRHMPAHISTHMGTHMDARVATRVAATSLHMHRQAWLQHSTTDTA